jgi:hypothetical protein
MFCAQMVGKPEIAPEPAASPAVAAAPFNSVRRFNPVVAGFDPVVASVARSLVGSAM